MAKVVIANTDSPKDSRTPINNMMTELYTGANTVAATEKTTPVDADILPIQNSAATNLLYYFTWANLKATLKTYFDTLYTKATGAEINTGTDDVKFATAKAIADSYLDSVVYAELSSIWTTTTIGSFVDVAGLSVTITADGTRKVKITAYTMNVSCTGAGTLIFSIREGSTEIGRMSNNSNYLWGTNTLVITPSAGSHTYKISVYTNAASGTTTVSKDTYGNSFIMAEII